MSLDLSNHNNQEVVPAASLNYVNFIGSMTIVSCGRFVHFLILLGYLHLVFIVVSFQLQSSC